MQCQMGVSSIHQFKIAAILVLAMGALIGGVVMAAATTDKDQSSSASTSYFSQARKLFDAELINDYRQNGLANMPNLPSVPGLGMVLHLPDKVLRAELTMLQELIRMSREMIQSPVSALVNLPRDMSVMMWRVSEQMEQ